MGAIFIYCPAPFPPATLCFTCGQVKAAGTRGRDEALEAVLDGTCTFLSSLHITLECWKQHTKPWITKTMGKLRVESNNPL